MYNKEIVENLKKQNLTVYEEIYQLRIELVSGCNLNCEFCGVSSKKNIFMDRGTFLNILEGLTSRIRRIEFALHGEPSLHPDLPYLIAVTREKFPHVQILMISNCETYRMRDNFEGMLSLFDAGLDCLQSNMYNQNQFHWMYKQLEEKSGAVSKYNIKVLGYMDDFSVLYTYKEHRDKVLLLADRRNAFPDKAWHKQPHNWGGNLPITSFDKFPLSKPCVEPLKYASVTAEGNVLLCCVDGSHATNFGNVNKTNLNEIWQSNDLQTVRYMLKQGWRHLFLPCLLCDARSVRSGLYAFWGGVNDIRLLEVQKVIKEHIQLQAGTDLTKNLKNFYEEQGMGLDWIKDQLNNIKEEKECS